MAVKRRTVWMTDEDWSAITGLAKWNGLTVSAFLRDRLVFDTRLERDVIADKPWEIAPASPTTVDHAPAFNTRPFTPVPKKGK